MIPVFAGIFVTWFDLMQLFDLEAGWFWKNVVSRSLLSVVPGTWIDVANLDGEQFHGPGQLTALLSLRTTYSVLATPKIWIGAARSEEHTSELQSIMRISYAVLCLKK